MRLGHVHRRRFPSAGINEGIRRAAGAVIVRMDAHADYAPDYVAVASEYCALAGLPGIEQADVFEPMPEEVHSWRRGQA